MIVINLYGAPGAGKSTGAAYLFSLLKLAGINAELVTEFAKDKVWEESKAVFENQAYLFGKQYFRMSRVDGKVDVVVTDSPLLLSSYYNKNDKVLGKEFDALVTKVAKSYDSINIFINRVKPYNPKGRFQTEEESDLVCLELKNFLKEHDIDCLFYNGCQEDYNKLFHDIVTLLADKNLINKFKIY